VLLNLWLEMVYIFLTCILLLVVWHSFAVYFLRFLYIILEVLIGRLAWQLYNRAMY